MGKIVIETVNETSKGLTVTTTTQQITPLNVYPILMSLEKITASIKRDFKKTLKKINTGEMNDKP